MKRKKGEELSDIFEENKPSLIAKKSFRLVQNDYDRQIAEGDDLSDIPKRFLENLKTEGII